MQYDAPAHRLRPHNGMAMVEKGVGDRVNPARLNGLPNFGKHPNVMP
jgi:hypothetical protein